MPIEEWRPVVGYAGYEVSNLGRVRSLNRTLSYRWRDEVRARQHAGRILSPGVCESGHLNVALGRGNSRLIHHLVLEAFVGPMPDGQEGCHGDGEPGNNRLDNLRWDTRAGNVADTFRHGTAAIEERHPKAKLTRSEAAQIKRLLSDGALSQYQIAAQFGVSRGCVQMILLKRNWKNVEVAA